MAKFLISFLALVIALFVVAPAAQAKVKATWTVSSTITSFEVDDQGSLFEITAAKSESSSGTRLSTVSWQLNEWKSGKTSVYGNGVMTQTDFPPDAVDCTIAGFWHKTLLLCYIDANNELVYAVYQIQTKKLKIRTGVFYYAQVGETMELYKTLIISTISAGGVESLKQYNLNFVLNTAKGTIGGLGTLTPINYPVEVYWKSVAGASGADKTVVVYQR